jgi:hypothetical protein
MNTMDVPEWYLLLSVGNGVVSAMRSAQLSMITIANMFATMSTMLASKFSRLKLALDIAVSAPKIAIQITVLDHLNSASTTVSMNTMRAEVRSILKPAWLSE